MTGDWAAVARVVDERMKELGLTQLDLVERSQVSKTMVAEIRRNSEQRRRSRRTMEALSQGLEWHPGHLEAVAYGLRIPELGEPVVRSDDDRLAVIEYMLEQVLQQLGEMKPLGQRLDAIDHKVDSIARQLNSVTGRPHGGERQPWTQ